MKSVTNSYMSVVVVDKHIYSGVHLFFVLCKVIQIVVLALIYILNQIVHKLCMNVNDTLPDILPLPTAPCAQILVVIAYIFNF